MDVEDPECRGASQGSIQGKREEQVGRSPALFSQAWRCCKTHFGGRGVEARREVDIKMEISPNKRSIYSLPREAEYRPRYLDAMTDSAVGDGAPGSTRSLSLEYESRSSLLRWARSEATV